MNGTEQNACGCNPCAGSSCNCGCQNVVASDACACGSECRCAGECTPLAASRKAD